MEDIKLIKISSMVNTKPRFNFFCDSIYETIAQLDQEYPQFFNWYYQKVINNISIGMREILVAVSDDSIAGLAILKNTTDEKKICTLRVIDKFQNKGIGKSLIKNSFDFLHTEKPLITVSSERDHQFKKLFDYFGFQKKSELLDYYMKDISEITYNGFLERSSFVM